LISESNPAEAEKNIRTVKFGSTIDIVVDSLWKECLSAYFHTPPMPTVALLVGGVCAEAAHRFYCKEKGASAPLLKGSWEELIDYSTTQKLLPHPSIGKLLNLIRKDYRNPWIHLDLDKITKKLPSTGMNKDLSALIFSPQLALNCLWLTSVELSAFYGSSPPLFEPAIM
jgi:hypothetical protein